MNAISGAAPSLSACSVTPGTPASSATQRARTSAICAAPSDQPDELAPEHTAAASPASAPVVSDAPSCRRAPGQNGWPSARKSRV